VKDVLNRLKQKYRDYKTIYYLENRKDPYSLYQELFSVDYKIGKCKDRYIADLSFSFLHWNLIEQLEQGHIRIKDIDNEQIELMIYNILPGGDTVFHKLNKHGDILE
jgi:hypothetical protein